jgi:hypothetical protein
MSEYAISAVWSSPEQARATLEQRIGPWCREQWAAGRERLVVTVREQEDQRSLQQNAFYWSFVLKQISQQAVVDGIGSDENGWHYFFKKTVLGYRVTRTKVPGSKRPVIRRELCSTKGLSVKAMSKYLEEVMAKAATEFGVTFEDGKRWEDWQV